MSVGTLIGNLLGDYSDDIAKAATKSAAKAVANKIDDSARVIANTADDVIPMFRGQKYGVDDLLYNKTGGTGSTASVGNAYYFTPNKGKAGSWADAGIIEVPAKKSDMITLNELIERAKEADKIFSDSKLAENFYRNNPSEYDLMEAFANRNYRDISELTGKPFIQPDSGQGEELMETLFFPDTNPELTRQYRTMLKDSATNVANSPTLQNGKFDKLLKKAKNYKSAERFEKMNNPIKGSEIWGEKPTSIFQRDSRAVRVNMFPNDATKGTGITKQYLLNLLKDAYDQGITDIVPSYGIYTKEGASFMNHLADQGWVNSVGKNGINSYTIAPKISEWSKTNPLADIYNEANKNIGGSVLSELLK